MFETKQDYSGLTIAQLNEIRRGLVAEVRDLRKRQADALDKVYQEVVKDQEDIAENYFNSANDANGKFFSQRLDSCVRTMRIEVKKLEESVGAQLGEVEEELESSLLRLAAKEKELDNVKNQILGPVTGSKEYKQFLDSLLQKLPDANAAVADASKLKDLLDWKHSYESRLEEIIQGRTMQLEKEILNVQAQLQSLSDPSLTQARPKRMEHVSQALNKVIDAQLQNQHHIMDAERDRLLKQHFMDQMILHKSFVNKYNAIKSVHQEEEDTEKKKKGYHQNPLRLQQQQSIHSVHASHHVTELPSLPTGEESHHHSSISAQVDNSYCPSFLLEGQSWRSNLVDVLENRLVDGATILAEAHTAHEQWLRSQMQPLDIPAMTMADIAVIQEMSLQSGNISARRSSVAFFTDADTLLSESVMAVTPNDEAERPTVTPTMTPAAAAAAVHMKSPSHFAFTATPTTATSHDKLVSKSYEDTVVKLMHVYQRYNDGRVAPLAPQLLPAEPSERSSSPTMTHNSSYVHGNNNNNSNSNNVDMKVASTKGNNNSSNKAGSNNAPSVSPYRGFHRNL